MKSLPEIILNITLELVWILKRESGIIPNNN